MSNNNTTSKGSSGFKFRITTKLITGLLVLAVLAFAFGGIVLFYINKVEVALNEVTDSAAPTVETADDLVMNILEANKIAEEIIADEELHEINLLIQEFRDFDKEFLKSYQELDALVGDVELLDELYKVQAEHIEFIKHANEMFEARILQLEEEINADNLLLGFDNIGSSLIVMLEKFSDENENEMARIEEQADQIVEAGTASVGVLNHLIGNLFEEHYPVVEAALKLQSLIIEMQDTAGEYMTTETEEGTRQPAIEFKKLTVSAQPYFDVLHQLAETTEDKQDAITIEETFDNWVITASKEEQLFDTHFDMLEAKYTAYAAIEKLELDADAVAKALDIVTAKADVLSSSADEKAAKIVTQAQTTIFAFIIISILIAGVLIIIVIKSVTSPISKMTSIMEELADHNFDIEIPVASRSDEIGDMAAALVVFKDNMIKADQLAYYDVLTGLPNRTLFYDRLEQSFIRAGRNKTIIALLFLDLDNFKVLNDTHGHALGDELLRIVAERLLSSVRRSDTVSRLGGDEFTIIISDISDIANASYIASSVAENIINSLSRDFELGEITHKISTSLGIALYPQDGSTISELVKHADTAMYQAKTSGKSRYKFFSKRIFELQNDKLKLIEDLHSALQENELVLFYQPQISLHNDKLVGFEALIRWQHPKKGLLPPGNFISFAEETGQIIKIGEWVIKTAMAQLAQWHQEGNAELKLSVNLSVEQVRQSGLSKFVQKELEKNQITPEKFCFEITETVMNEDTLKSKKVLRELKDLGFKVSLDDFGTGYSSMTYIKHFPVDELKIDRSFIQDMFGSLEDKSIIFASLSLASHLSVTTVAEGVETAEQVVFLKENGCDYIQGYYIAKPMPVGDIENWMKSFSLTTD